MAETEKNSKFQKIRYTEGVDLQYKEQLLQNVKTEMNVKEKRK